MIFTRAKLAVVSQLLVLGSSLAAQDVNFTDKLRAFKDYVSCQFPAKAEEDFDAMYRDALDVAKNEVTEQAYSWAQENPSKKKQVSELAKKVTKAGSLLALNTAI